MLNFSRTKIGDLTCILASHPAAKAQADAVVILCHGFGAPGTDLVSLSEAMIGNDDSLDNVRFVFPAAPLELDPAFDARAWWMIDIEKIQMLQMTGEIREMRNESPEELPARREAMNEIIKFSSHEFNVDSSRIVVGGFSQGSMLMTDVAIHYPEKLGGLIVWSGALINETDWSAAAEKQASLNVVQTHGTSDPVLPYVGAEYLRDMLVNAGHQVSFIQFPGQHAIPPAAIAAATELLKSVALQKK